MSRYERWERPLFDPPARLLEDGCIWCGKSLVYCDANQYISDARCCPACTGVSAHTVAQAT